MAEDIGPASAHEQSKEQPKDTARREAPARGKADESGDDFHVRGILVASVAVAFAVAQQLGMKQAAYVYGLVVSIWVLALTISGGSRSGGDGSVAPARCEDDRARIERLLETSRREVTILLEKQSPSDQLGFDIKGFNGRGLKIQEIKPGLGESWNAAHPEKTVQAGDCIVAVNETRGRPDELLRELGSSAKLKLVIEQPLKRDGVARQDSVQTSTRQRSSPSNARKVQFSAGPAACGAGATAKPMAEDIFKGLSFEAVGAGDSAQADAEQDDHDPLWTPGSDWTNVAEARKLQPPTEAPPTEVFSIHDTNTWLANMEKRRDQAERAGKKKLAQKISKEIAEATRQAIADQAYAAARQPPSTPRGAQPQTPAEPKTVATPQTVTLDDDQDEDMVESIYDMDWSNVASQLSDKALPTAVTAP